MDEPTANIDMATDDHIQRLMRSALKHLTVITIAHRLNTVIDFDKILVMEAGGVAEFGAPLDLLADPASHLSTTVQAMGKQAADKLIQKARGAKAARALLDELPPRPSTVSASASTSTADTATVMAVAAATQLSSTTNTTDASTPLSTPLSPHSSRSFTAQVLVPPSAQGGDVISVTSPDGKEKIEARLPQHSIPGDTVVLRVQSNDSTFDSINSLPISPLPPLSPDGSSYSAVVKVPEGAIAGDLIEVPPPESNLSQRIKVRIPAGINPGDSMLLFVQDGKVTSVEKLGSQNSV